MTLPDPGPAFCHLQDSNTGRPGSFCHVNDNRWMWGRQGPNCQNNALNHPFEGSTADLSVIETSRLNKPAFELSAYIFGYRSLPTYIHLTSTHDECFQAFPFFTRLPLLCIIVNKKDGGGVGTTLLCTIQYSLIPSSLHNLSVLAVGKVLTVHRFAVIVQNSKAVTRVVFMHKRGYFGTTATALLLNFINGCSCGTLTSYC